ncbi:MAG: TraB/GumN family protein [Moraxellaceae bacterium]|nr:MAG: TraB/GumN family protein [Moraxellaceae bacterium]
MNDEIKKDQSDVEEVLVIGAQQGPSLWKVYKDDHVLWVMGVLSPIPKKLDWRSAQVEDAIASSQELLLPVDFDFNISVFKQITLMPSLIGIKKNPDKQTLKEILPVDLYARWSVLKAKHIGNDKGIEKERPIFAAVELYEEAIDKSGLEDDHEIWRRVSKLAQKNKLTITKPIIKQDMKNPKAIVKGFKKADINDTECFTKIIERVEFDMEAMRVRANAWATGDMETLNKISVSDAYIACSAVIFQSSIAQELGMENVPERLKTVWLEAAEKALTTNKSTFAVLPISEMMQSDGYIAELKARNYKVEGWGFASATDAM